MWPVQAEVPEVRDRALTLNVETVGIDPSGGRMSSSGGGTLPRSSIIAIIVSAVVASVTFVALAAFFWKKQREEAQGDYEDVRHRSRQHTNPASADELHYPAAVLLPAACARVLCLVHFCLHALHQPRQDCVSIAALHSPTQLGRNNTCTCTL